VALWLSAILNKEEDMNTRKQMQHRPILILALLLALVGLFAAAPARAADTRGGDQVVIGRDEVISDDLYVAANTVTIDGTLKGDLVAVASQVTINGTVMGDVLAAGQAIIINGMVNDDVRAAGQAIMLGPGARVAGDLAIGGMSLENRAGSVVGGDLLVGAYQTLLAGQIGRNVWGGMNRMELHGSVGGNLDIAVSGDAGVSGIAFSPAGQTPIPTVHPNLTVADSARIGGKLIYESSAEATINPGAQVAGGIMYNRLPAAQPATPAPSIPGLPYLQRLAGLLLIGLLLLWLMPTWTRRMADRVEAQPLPSLAWGLVAFVAFMAAVIAILVLTIMLAITFGYLTLGSLVALIVGLGLLINAALVISYIAFVGYVAAIIVAFMAGRWLLRKTQPAWAEQPIVPLVIGLLLYIALTAIPWLGTLIGLLVTLLALGALWNWGRAMIERQRPTPQPMVGLQPA
jgi:cytoskeletal protein CcmA (bactofilin family)